MFRSKRVYDRPAPEDGYRVLVDRLWPRGLSKQAAAVDEWLKEIAPSNELRRWFNHDAGQWREFADRYRTEMASPERSAALDRLRRAAREHGTVTLLFATREAQHSHARLLIEILTAKTGSPD